MVQGDNLINYLLILLRQLYKLIKLKHTTIMHIPMIINWFNVRNFYNDFWDIGQNLVNIIYHHNYVILCTNINNNSNKISVR